MAGKGRKTEKEIREKGGWKLKEPIPTREKKPKENTERTKECP